MSRRQVEKVREWLFLKISDSSTPEMRKVYAERLDFLARHGHLLELAEAPAPVAEDGRQLALVG